MYYLIPYLIVLLYSEPQWQLNIKANYQFDRSNWLTTVPRASAWLGRGVSGSPHTTPTYHYTAIQFSLKYDNAFEYKSD